MLVEHARALAPALVDRATRTEENRAPLDETIAEFIDSGVLTTLTPRVYGGPEHGLDTAAEIVQILSAACPSTGWVAAFYIGAPWRLNIFTEQAQREILADNQYALMCGTAIPLPYVSKVDGGYRISGQTAFLGGLIVFGIGGDVHELRASQ